MVSFGESGLDWVEVSDDGRGIAAADVEMIGRRHHTSKITRHDDIFTVRSFGFRGEAMHALTALSEEIVITSRTEAQDTGTRIVFSGGEARRSTTACTRGTTVRVVGLLRNLPVRLSEWKRNSKRHFSHCLWLLQSYILAVPMVRFRCTNVSGNSSQTLFVSSGTGNVSKSYAEAFKGELRQKLVEACGEATRFSWKLYYCLSARKSTDRQFCFINQRPCDLPKVLKKLNETCKAYAIEGAPIFALYLTSDELIDINLTPDKRQIVVPFEMELIDSLCSAFASRLSAERDLGDAPAESLIEVAPSRHLDTSAIERGVSSPSSQSLPLSIDMSSQRPAAPPTDTSQDLQSNTKGVPSLSPSPPSPSFIPHACTHVDIALEGQQIQILDRADFAKMTILGQFNRGFILTSIAREDAGILVFIIDQHASDERARLERLQRDLTFNVQSMVVPRPLSLGLEDQLFVAGNLDKFKSYGFSVEVTQAEEADERTFRLLSTPSVASVQCSDQGASPLSSPYR